MVGGWFDFGMIATQHTWLRLRKSAAPVKLLIGPWLHNEPGTDRVAGIDMGSNAAIDLDARYLRWFDHHLKGIDTGMMDEPVVEVFATGKNQWLRGDDFPLPETERMTLHLSSEAGANSCAGDGTLSLDPPADGRDYDIYTSDPADPAPSLWFGAAADYDSLVRERKDLLVYETEPLSEPMMVAGPIALRLFASSSAPDTDWIAYWRVFNEETGQQNLMNRGVLRASYRAGNRIPEPIEPDKVYEYMLDLHHAGVFLSEKSVIRIEIASAAFPDWSRNLQTGEPSELESRFVSAEQRIWHSEECPSCLILPLVSLDDFR
jgi:putative CocE/NonD family hydrolase